MVTLTAPPVDPEDGEGAHETPVDRIVQMNGGAPTSTVMVIDIVTYAALTGFEEMIRGKMRKQTAVRRSVLQRSVEFPLPPTQMKEGHYLKPEKAMTV